MKLKTLENQYREKLKERQDQIRSMRAKGLTWRTIGLELGITRQRAQQIGKRQMAKCKKCGGEVVTLSPGGPGQMIDCIKCSACGHSVNS